MNMNGAHIMLVASRLLLSFEGCSHACLSAACIGFHHVGVMKAVPVLWQVVQLFALFLGCISTHCTQHFGSQTIMLR